MHAVPMTEGATHRNPHAVPDFEAKVHCSNCKEFMPLREFHPRWSDTKARWVRQNYCGECKTGMSTIRKAKDRVRRRIQMYAQDRALIAFLKSEPELLYRVLNHNKPKLKTFLQQERVRCLHEERERTRNWGGRKHRVRDVDELFERVGLELGIMGDGTERRGKPLFEPNRSDASETLVPGRATARVG